MSALLLLLSVQAASGTSTLRHAMRSDADGTALCGRVVAVPRLPHTWRPGRDTCRTCRTIAERTS